MHPPPTRPWDTLIIFASFAPLFIARIICPPHLCGIDWSVRPIGAGTTGAPSDDTFLLRGYAPDPRGVRVVDCVRARRVRRAHARYALACSLVHHRRGRPAHVGDGGAVRGGVVDLSLPSLPLSLTVVGFLGHRAEGVADERAWAIRFFCLIVRLDVRVREVVYRLLCLQHG